MTVPALFCSCLLILLLVLSWRVLNWVWLKPRKLEKRLREEGFRGNPYKLLHGDFKEISAMLAEAYSKPLLNLSDDILRRTSPQFLQTVKKYGKNSYLWLGPKPSVVVIEPNLAKEVTTKTEVFHKAEPLNPLAKLLVEPTKHRKRLNPAFHIEKLKLMLPAFCESASEMLRKWEAISSEKGPIFEVDVWPHLQTMTSDVISRTAFGSNSEEGGRIFELQREQLEHYMKVARSLYFPGFRFLPTKRNRRMKQIAKEVGNSIREIINARLQSMKAGECKGDDLLGLLLEISNSQETGIMTIEDVINECKLFYFAGQETTAVLLVWTMVLLSKFQDWQSRAREEVLHMFGTNKPDFDRLSNLKIVNMILNEVLRLYPPVVMMYRKPVKETKIGELTLPAEVEVAIPIGLIHHDTEIWGDDAKEFKPERFAEGVSQATKGQFVFFPFGWGPRNCIGQNFAMLEARMSLAMILQRFSFQLSPSYSHAPRALLTLQPEFGAHLILQKL